MGLWLVYTCVWDWQCRRETELCKVVVFHFNVAFSRLCNISRFDLVVPFRDTDLFFNCASHLEENIYEVIGD